MERLNFEESAKNRILEVLKSGGVVLLPFDTSYGLVADSANNLAVDHVFKIKDRDKNKPMSVVVSGLEMAKEYCQVDKRQFGKYFPGSYTLIFKTNQKGQSLATHKNHTQAIRMPDNKFLLDLAKKLGRPFTATSANLTGQPNTFSVEEFLGQAKKQAESVDLIIDGGRLQATKPSTIIDLTSGQPVILRQ